jgi:hypothetical protein
LLRSLVLTMSSHHLDAKVPEKIERSLDSPAAIENVNTMVKHSESELIDDATNRRLFWMVNRRVLVVMIGVSVLGTECTK